MLQHPKLGNCERLSAELLILGIDKFIALLPFVTITKDRRRPFISRHSVPGKTLDNLQSIMHSRFIAVTLASLSLASQAVAWGCIGQDCNQAADQIAFSAPEPASYEGKVKSLAWEPTPGQGWQWSSCGTGDEVVNVESIVVSPDPPVPGQNLTVRAKGTVKDEVSVS